MAGTAGALVLRREDDGQVLCERCIVADSVFRRLRGLLGRRSLSPGDGIVLRPGWSVHTIFMLFSIDVVFLDGNQVVVKVVRNLKPWRAATCRGARGAGRRRARRRGSDPPQDPGRRSRVLGSAAEEWARTEPARAGYPFRQGWQQWGTRPADSCLARVTRRPFPPPVALPSDAG